jgi:hypothetical protein
MQTFFLRRLLTLKARYAALVESPPRVVAWKLSESQFIWTSAEE